MISLYLELDQIYMWRFAFHLYVTPIYMCYIVLYKILPKSMSARI